MSGLPFLLFVVVLIVWAVLALEDALGESREADESDETGPES